MGAETNQTVLIVGGGIGGLTTALALAHRSISSHILERRTQFEEDGAGIQIGPNGARLLIGLGLESALAPIVATPDAIAVHNGTTGRLLTDLPLGQWIAERHGAPYWVAHRADLHQVLRAAAQAHPLIEISTGADIVEIAPNETAPATATTTDGKTHTGAAIICADGVWSSMRDTVQRMQQPATPDDAAQYSGWSAARTVCPLENTPPGIAANKTGVWLCRDAHVVHYPVRAGSELAIVVILKDDTQAQKSWNADTPPQWIERGVDALHDTPRTLISSVRGWRKWGLYHRPVADRWSYQNVALLGDAAHPVLPFLAQGAVMAIEDAAVVSKLLAHALGEKNPHAIPKAFFDYAHSRRMRVEAVRKASENNGKIYHLHGPMAQARNFVLRTASPQRLMARYDWLYGWHPN